MKHDKQLLTRLLTPEVLSTEEQMLLMAQLRKTLDEFISEENLSESHQLALAGFLMRYSVGLYKGVVDFQELEDLFDYVLDKLEDIPAFTPKNRIIN